MMFAPILLAWLLAVFTLTAAGLVNIIITLAVFALIVSLLYYLVTILPIVSPYKEWILIVLKVLVVLVLIGMLLNFAGVPIIQMR